MFMAPGGSGLTPSGRRDEERPGAAQPDACSGSLTGTTDIDDDPAVGRSDDRRLPRAHHLAAEHVTVEACRPLDTGGHQESAEFSIGEKSPDPASRS
jgi:hypothetical protein